MINITNYKVRILKEAKHTKISTDRNDKDKLWNHFMVPKVVNKSTTGIV